MRLLLFITAGPMLEWTLECYVKAVCGGAQGSEEFRRDPPDIFVTKKMALFFHIFFHINGISTVDSPRLAHHGRRDTVDAIAGFALRAR